MVPEIMTIPTLVSTVRVATTSAILTVLFGAVGSGCAPRQTAAETGVATQVLHLGNGPDPADLDPQTVTGRPESSVIRALMEGLVDYDPRDLSPTPAAAERWEISPDGRTYTFFLRADGRWSNGEPVTAADFVHAYRRMLTPALGAEYAYMLFVVDGAEAFLRGDTTDFGTVGFRALDARTLEIRLRQPVPWFLNLIAHTSWYPVHLPTLERFGGAERKGTAWTRPGNYVGNGAFVLEEWRPGQVIAVRRSETYWDRANVRLTGIRFHPTESQDTEERMFRSGQIHKTNALPVSKIDTYRGQRGGEALRIDPYFATTYLRVNVGAPGLGDARVRRALSLAIDREAITASLHRGARQPAYALTPPDPAGFVAQIPATPGGDPVEAQRLLTEAGFPGGRGLPPIDMLYPTSDNGRLNAEALQEMWRSRLGIQVNLVNQEWRVYLDSMNTRRYGLALSGWVGDYLDPNTFLDMMVTDGGNNRTGWSHAEYDALVAAVLEAPDEAARFAIYQRQEEILAAEAPVVPLYYATSIYLLHPAVRGWYPTLLDVHPYKHVWLESD
jgi:oligopeptide transport system substrate-binding protein